MNTKNITYFIFIISLFFFSKIVTANAKFFDNSYALVICIETYPQENWNDLEGSIEDAKEFVTILENQGFVVKPLYNEQATRKEIIKEMNKIAYKVRENDRVLIFFSGMVIKKI